MNPDQCEVPHGPSHALGAGYGSSESCEFAVSGRSIRYRSSPPSYRPHHRIRAAVLAGEARRALWAICHAEQVEHRATVDAGQRGDLVARGIELANAARGPHLEGEVEDALLVVRPVVRRPVRDVHIARLLWPVAVQGGCTVG